MLTDTNTLPEGVSGFDSDLGPEHPTNVEAAKLRGLKYDPKSRTYRNYEGVSIRDECGNFIIPTYLDKPNLY